VTDQLTEQAVPGTAPDSARERAAAVLARTKHSFGEGGWSLRRRLAAAFAVAGALLIIGCLLGGLALNSMISAVNVQVNTLGPAGRTTDQLLVSYLNQETGVRGYILTSQTSFLAPYHQGTAAAAGDIASLRQLVSSYPQLRHDLVVVQRQASLWRASYAQPAIAAVMARHPVSTPLEATGRSSFDQLRADVAALNREITTEHQAAVTRLHSATSLVIIVAITGAILLVAGAAAAWAGLTSWVLRPLGSLRDEAQAVASGGLDHKLTVGGPREMVDLAADLEAMRRQLLLSLDEVSFKAAELQRSNRELEQFAYVASHDLQEPLRKVASFCQMLESRYGDQLDERGHQYIYYAVDGAKRMQQLITELLMFSRVGQAGTVREAVNLNEIVHRAAEALEATIEDTDAQVVVSDLPTVSGDPTLLTQLFQNLIGNAIKFRRVDESPVVEISAKRSGDEWEFACNDNGIGIAPAYAERVFVIFQRLHPREAYQGTGIGLALCRKIVDFHGGRIWVDTQESADQGTTIRWTLPAQQEAT
jgi:signal transduction histidine kinase